MGTGFGKNKKEPEKPGSTFLNFSID